MAVVVVVAVVAEDRWTPRKEEIQNATELAVEFSCLWSLPSCCKYSRYPGFRCETP